MRVHVVSPGARHMLPLVLQLLRLHIVSVSVLERYRSVTLSNFLRRLLVIELLIITSSIGLSSPSRYSQIMIVNGLAMVGLVTWSLALWSLANTIRWHVTLLNRHQTLGAIMHTQLRIIDLLSILNLVLNGD